MKTATKIAVTYEKGGVGKTTTAVNMSALLADKGHKVLLVDLDPQSYATGYYALYSDDLPSIYDVMTRDYPAEKAIRHTHIENLDLLPCTFNMSSIETHLAARPMRQEYVLKDALTDIAASYDFIILDCPPAGLRIKTNALAAATGLILPTIPDDYAIQGLRCISTQLVNMKRGSNPKLEVYGVLITLDERNANKRAYKEALQAQTIFPCFRTTIRKNTTLSAAINAHEPIQRYDRTSNGCKDYTAFVDELLEKLEA